DVKVEFYDRLTEGDELKGKPEYSLIWRGTGDITAVIRDLENKPDSIFYAGENPSKLIEYIRKVKTPYVVIADDRLQDKDLRKLVSIEGFDVVSVRKLPINDELIPSLGGVMIKTDYLKNINPKPWYVGIESPLLFVLLSLQGGRWLFLTDEDADVDSEKLAYLIGISNLLALDDHYYHLYGWGRWQDIARTLKRYYKNPAKLLYSKRVNPTLRRSYSRRVKIVKDNESPRGVVLMLSGVPATDSGGGQRPAQLALAFAKKGYLVHFVNRFDSTEENKKIFLEHNPAFIEHQQLFRFSGDEFISRYGDFKGRVVAISEFPMPEYRDIFVELRQKMPDVKLVYDCIDNWDSDLGWFGYTPQLEKEFVELSDLVVASAKVLVDKMKELAGDKEVIYVPQGIPSHLLKFYGMKGERPSDLPENDKIVLYFGALWGSWLWWDLIEESARRLPDVEFVFIGHRVPEVERRFEQFKNVHFLGLKPQRDLPAYLNNASVTIIPFYVNEITIATNPLKVYEYLAGGKPVVATPMPELEGLPYVLFANSPEEFATQIKKAFDIKPDLKEIQNFISQNTWEKRVEKILNSLNMPT
ncbi:MAG: glycosyltransferase family 1 protein, partial [Chlorobi bacterium]|nr:glycosyltransferase family 1 protein [Chlorobiota bacterium]